MLQNQSTHTWLTNPHQETKILRKNLDLDVPDPEVDVPFLDSPGDISPPANESENKSLIPVTFPKAKEQEIGSPLVTREKPKEIKIPLALRRLF